MCDIVCELVSEGDSAGKDMPTISGELVLGGPA